MNKINSTLLVGLLIGFTLLVCTTVVTSNSVPEMVPIPFECMYVSIVSYPLPVIIARCRTYEETALLYQYDQEYNVCILRFPTTEDECLRDALQLKYRPSYSFRSKEECESWCVLPKGFKYTHDQIRYNFDGLKRGFSAVAPDHDLYEK